MNAPIAFKRSYLASQRSTAKKFVKALADATQFIIANKLGTVRPLSQLLNTNESEVIDFAYDYLHANSEATLYPPAESVENLIKMSGFMDKKLQSINAKQVVDWMSSPQNKTNGCIDKVTPRIVLPLPRSISA